MSRFLSKIFFYSVALGKSLQKTMHLPDTLRLGRSPCVISPIVLTSLPNDLRSAGSAAENVISRLSDDIADAKDNLLQAKVIQASYANTFRGQEAVYQLGDKVMLSTFNSRRDYKRNGDGRVAKFFLR